MGNVVLGVVGGQSERNRDNGVGDFSGNKSASSGVRYGKHKGKFT